jgi:DNA-binding beta-propeller fold protein YncE
VELHPRPRPRAAGIGWFVFLVIVILGLAPGYAEADAPALLWQSPEARLSGSGAGQLQNPVGVAGDPSTGNLYIADEGNSRIVELDPWGQFVKAFGWGVDTGAAELQTCTAASTCQKGLLGAGAGQVSLPAGVAVDAEGNVYVEELVFDTFYFGEESMRVEKFDSEGNFLLMIGGEVNKTKSAEGGTTAAERNLCTKAQMAAGEVCGSGVPGSGPGQFAHTPVFSNRIGVDDAGNLYVGDVGRIQKFDSEGHFLGEIKGAVTGETVQSLAVDGGGALYVTFTNPLGPPLGSDLEGIRDSKDDVRKLDSEGKVIQTFPVIDPRNLAVDGVGDLYVVSRPGTLEGDHEHIVSFSAGGSKLIPDSEEEENGEHFGEARKTSLSGLGTGAACGLGDLGLSDLYVSTFHSEPSESYIQAFGPPPDPDLCPPPLAAPTVADQYGVSAGTDAATVKADINPHFWPDVSYYLEYGTGSCAAGGCPNRVPVSPGQLQLGKRVVNAPVATGGLGLGGLSPSTTYHFRFVAESSGGGPTFGVDPDGGGPEEADFEHGLDATFTTFGNAPAPGPCPNDAFRTGAGARLPDCRAYEMVSPVDKHASDIVIIPTLKGDPAGLDQALASGEQLTYSTYRSFGDSASSPYVSQYMATRQAGVGWSNHGISPPRGSNILPAGWTLDTEFRYFSDDLCRGWIMHDANPILASGAIENFANFYEDRLCGGGFQALTTEEPDVAPTAFAPELQGVAEEGGAVLLRAEAKLTEDAAAGKFQVYISAGGQMRLICILPSGLPSGQACSAGTATEAFQDGRSYSVKNALSRDGSKAYWTSTPTGASGPGQLYLRLNPSLPQSPLEAGKCSDLTLACTLPVSSLAGSNLSRFLGANPDGTRALFSTSGKDLYEYVFKPKGGQVHLIAHKALGILGMSEDLQRVYLVSEEALDGAATAGEPNLYYEEAGSFTFIATLSSQDAETVTLVRRRSPINIEPRKHSAQVSADGLSVAFMSNARLTGFNNTDLNSRQADAEVYLYRVGTGLRCVSCNPTGVRPTGVNLNGGTAPFWVAAQIPKALSQLHAPQVLSDNGTRLFFESYEALVNADTNGEQDVYEWEAAGEGDCSGGAGSYSPPAGGCVSLISGGTSMQPSAIVEATPDGHDVFFTTGQSLVAQDPTLIDIYDARVGGGFPAPSTPEPPCQGEACQPPASAQGYPTPPSAGFHGPGNPSPKHKKCPKGKRKVKRHGKVRCVKAKHRAHQHRKGAGR